jgi:hypothetical protein
MSPPRLNSRQGRASVYAGAKLAEMRARWIGAPGDAVRAMGPHVFPGVPGPALLAKSANSSNYRERYCEGFCAIGLYQTPETSWDRLRTQGRVRALLGGRDAVPSRPANAAGVYPWQAASAIPDQVAVGLWDVHDGGESVTARIPAALRPQDPAGQWAWMLATMAYTGGAGGAAATVRRYADALAAVPEASRFGALLQAVARDPSVPREPIGHTVARSYQQLQLGGMIAASTGASAAQLAWYAPDLGGLDVGDVQLSVSGAYYPGPRGPLPGALPGGPGAAAVGASSGVGWGWALAVGAVVAVAVYAVARGLGYGGGSRLAPRALVMDPAESARWARGDRRTWNSVGALAGVASERGGGRAVYVLDSQRRTVAEVTRAGGRTRVVHRT